MTPASASNRLYDLLSELLDRGNDGGLTPMQIEEVTEEAILDWTQRSAGSLEEE